MALDSSNYSLELRGGRIWIEVCCERRSLSRRILTIDRHRAGVLDCTVQLFAGKTGALAFRRSSRPQTACRTLRGDTPRLCRTIPAACCSGNSLAGT